MSNLIAFLKARLDEDERVLEDASDGRLARTSRQGQMIVADAGVLQWFPPKRLLADVAAKRQIIELAEEASSLDMSVDLERRVGPSRDEVTDPYVGALILRQLAAPYVGHPDYSAEWALDSDGEVAEVHRVTTDQLVDFEAMKPVMEFVRAHGINPAHVPLPVDIVIRNGHVTLERCVLGEDGTVRYVDDDVVRERVTVKQVAPWPGTDAP